MNEHHYKKLEKDYQHCITRMHDLFKYGRCREYALETGIANAGKQFEVIKNTTNDKEIIKICDETSLFLSKAMKAESIKDL